MTRQEALDYQENKARNSGYRLTDAIIYSIRQLEGVVYTEDWKMVSTVEEVIKRLEEAKNNTVKEYDNLKLIKQVLDAVEEG